MVANEYEIFINVSDAHIKSVLFTFRAEGSRSARIRVPNTDGPSSSIKPERLQLTVQLLHCLDAVNPATATRRPPVAIFRSLRRNAEQDQFNSNYTAATKPDTNSSHECRVEPISIESDWRARESANECERSGRPGTSQPRLQFEGLFYQRFRFQNRISRYVLRCSTWLFGENHIRTAAGGYGISDVQYGLTGQVPGTGQITIAVTIYYYRSI